MSGCAARWQIQARKGQALSVAGLSRAHGAGAARAPHPSGLRKEPCPCTPGVRHLPCPYGALWKRAFTTGEPQCTLAASHLEKSIVFVSLALP